MDIKPLEGQVALELLDDGDDDDDTQPMAQSPGAVGAEDSYNEAIFAIVVGVGTKVNVKKGDTVICRPYVRNALRAPGSKNVVICDQYCIAAVVTKPAD